MVNSVFRAIKILEFLGYHEGANVTEISKALEFPKSTTHQILATLEKENVTTKDQNNRYNRYTFFIVDHTFPPLFG